MKAILKLLPIIAVATIVAASATWTLGPPGMKQAGLFGLPTTAAQDTSGW